MGLGQRFNEFRYAFELLALWAFSRVFVLLLAGRYASDVPLYREFVRRLSETHRPYADFPLDHPPVALFTIALPAVFPSVDYATAFRLLMLACDLGLFLMLANLMNSVPVHRAQLRTALLLYTWLGAIMFPFLYDRIDNVLALLLLALLWAGLHGRPLLGYLILVAGLGFNVGVCFLWPFWLLTDRAFTGEWRRPLGRFAGGVTFVLLVTWLGFSAFGAGLVSPVTYHWFRGIEIESLPAVIPFLAHLFGAPLNVDLRSGFAHLTGSIPDAVARVLLPTEMLLMGSLWAITAWRLRNQASLATREARWKWLAFGVPAHLLAFQLSSLVLPPQYVLWLIPFAAAGLPVVRSRIRWMTLWIAVTVYTVTVFPFEFASLINLDRWGVLLVVTRNVCLIVLLVWVFSLWMPKRATHSAAQTRPPRGAQSSASRNAPYSP